MNKTLLVVFVVVLAVGAIFWMNSSDSTPASAPEPAPQEAAETEENIEEENEEEEVVEDAPVSTAPAAPAAPVTTVADVDETLSDIDALLEPAYDDSSLDSEVNGGFDEMNNAYAF